MLLKRSPEFQIIYEFFEIQAARSTDASVILGIGDDCAIVSPSENSQLLISVDTSIANRHFPADAPAFDIAYRALNVAISDLAAMGAKPCWFTLALSLEQDDKRWLHHFSRGLFEAARHADISLIGGDTTKAPKGAPLSITVQVHGEVSPKTALLRSGAKAGDILYVTNTLGDGAAGLDCYMKQLDHPDLLTAYLRPEPQIKLGLELNGCANSCIDISDGLLADLAHILRGSEVGAELDLHRIPLSQALLKFCDEKTALAYALTGGDDYQLLFSSDKPIALDNITAIGRITEQAGIRFINDTHRLEQTLSITGFDHFHEPPL